MRKLKKTQGRKRAANTKPCRYGARCPNNGCMFYHEGSGYSSSHVSRSKERLKVSDAELTAQGQGQYFSASYEVERASSSNSDSGERGGVALIKQQDDASEMVKKLQSQLKEKNGGDELEFENKQKQSIKNKKKALSMKYYDDNDTVKIQDTPPVKKKFREEQTKIVKKLRKK